MNTTLRLTYLASIYNKDGSISKAKLRKLLFPTVSANMKKAKVTPVRNFLLLDDAVDWNERFYAVYPKAEPMKEKYVGWKYDPASSALEHADRFTEWVLEQIA